MTCVKEKIHVDSYVKIIKRIEREVEALKQQNEFIAGEVLENRNRHGGLQRQLKEE